MSFLPLFSLSLVLVTWEWVGQPVSLREPLVSALSPVLGLQECIGFFFFFNVDAQT